MNTGLDDVWNLVWKLDLFLCGHGNQQGLDSYRAERIPVVESVIETTDLLTKVAAMPNKLAQAQRNTVIPMVSRLARCSTLWSSGFPNWALLTLEARSLRDRGSGTAMRSRTVDQNGGAAARGIVSRCCGASVQPRGVTLVRSDGSPGWLHRLLRREWDGLAALGSVRSLLERQTG